MTRNKEPLVIPETEADSSLSAGIINLNDKIKEKYPSMYPTIVNICYEISHVGLPIAEACMLWDTDYEYFTSLMERDPLIKQVIEKKTLEYKRELLKILSATVRQGKNEKLAMDILQARFPDEFNRRKGSGNGSETDNNNIIVNAIQFVQNSGDSNTLINKTGGKPRTVENEAETAKKHERKSIMDRYSSMLS